MTSSVDLDSIACTWLSAQQALISRSLWYVRFGILILSEASFVCKSSYIINKLSLSLENNCTNFLYARVAFLYMYILGKHGLTKLLSLYPYHSALRDVAYTSNETVSL